MQKNPSVLKNGGGRALRYGTNPPTRPCPVIHKNERVLESNKLPNVPRILRLKQAA